MPRGKLIKELEQRSIAPCSLNADQKLIKAAMHDHGSNYKYSRAIKGAFGCVNAISLSKGAATFLAFGGDDCRVLVITTYD
jgi:hypothetical protein